MLNPNPNLDRLKAVSPTLLNLLTQVMEITVLTVGQDDIEKICADILRLADELNDLELTLFQVKIHNELHPDDWPASVHEGIERAVSGMAKQLHGTPASAGGGKE